MARPAKKRRICQPPKFNCFAPVKKDVPVGKEVPEGVVVLEVDEYECLRLIDHEGLTQGECAEQMNLVRTSVTGIYARARQKIAESLVNGKELWIKGGSYEVCKGGIATCPSRKDNEKCTHCSKQHAESAYNKGEHHA